MKANFPFALLCFAALAGIVSLECLARTSPPSAIADYVHKIHPDTPGNQTSGSIRADTLVYVADSTSTAPFTRQLDLLGQGMRGNSSYRIVVTGNGGAGRKQQRETRTRVNAFINYLHDVHGIDRDRFIVEYTDEGSTEYVNYRVATAAETSRRD